MMRNIVVFGDTPFAERIAFYIEFEGIDRILAFTQEERYISRSKINSYDVIPFETLDTIYDKDSFYIIIAIGYSHMNQLREKIYNKCQDLGYKIGSFVSSRASIYSSQIGNGTIILPNTFIGPYTKIQ